MFPWFTLLILSFFFHSFQWLTIFFPPPSPPRRGGHSDYILSVVSVSPAGGGLSGWSTRPKSCTFFRYRTYQWHSHGYAIKLIWLLSLNYTNISSFFNYSLSINLQYRKIEFHKSPLGRGRGGFINKFIQFFFE